MTRDFGVRLDVFEFLGRQLLGAGGFTKSQVMAEFGIEERQARNHIGAFRKALGGARVLAYERIGQRYALVDPRARGLEERLQRLYGDGNRVLQGFLSRADRQMIAPIGVFSREVGASVLPSLSVKDALMALHACANQLAIEPASATSFRWKGPVIPREVVDLGLYKAIRGYCLVSETWVFRPLTGRLNLGEVKWVDVDVHLRRAPLDEEWRESLDLRIRPHPKLSAEEQKIVSQQYLGLEEKVEPTRGREKQVRVRKALIPYFVEHWGVDATGQAIKPPYLYPLRLVNHQTIYRKGAILKLKKLPEFANPP